MKQLGRRHRPFYRICAIDGRAPRDGKVIEELGHYDPLVRETDARAILNGERIDYWLSVGAQPTEKVRVLIKKYGTSGTHVSAQQSALERLAIRPQAPPPVKVELKAPEPEGGGADEGTGEPVDAATGGGADA
jgi:small subunit ribosomal protein S16